MKNTNITRATFGGEYIVKVETVDRPTITVNRTGNGLANNCNDLIVCGNCGAVMSYKAKFCMGCGAKFEKVNMQSRYKDLEAQITTGDQLNGQMSFDDLTKEADE